MADPGNGSRFSIVPAQSVEDRRLSAPAFRVLACLGTYGDKDGWCWPSMGTIAARLGISRQAIQRHIRILVSAGYLEVNRRQRPNGSDTSNSFRLLFDRALFVVRDELEGGNDTLQGGQRHVAGGATSEVAPIKNAPLERKDIPTIATNEFDIFWRVYPSRKPHSNPKKPARAKFDAAVKRGVLPADIIRGAENYALCIERGNTGPKFVAQAQTWLNQERWGEYQEDVPAQKAKGRWL